MTASEEIDAKLAKLGDWRGATLARMRRLIREADPQVVEELKWRKPSNPSGVPTWSHAGILCTGELYKDKVKLTFARGAALADPAGLFNSGLGGGTRRDRHRRGRRGRRGGVQGADRRGRGRQPRAQVSSKLGGMAGLAKRFCALFGVRR